MARSLTATAHTGRTRKGNRWLRQGLAITVQAAGHSKNSYLRARFRRLAARRGKKRVTIAVAHTMLRIIYHLLLLRKGTHFRDLGPAYFDRLNPERVTLSHQPSGASGLQGHARGTARYHLSASFSGQEKNRSRFVAAPRLRVKNGL